MYVIKADGETLYNPGLYDERYQVINPELRLELNKAGSLSFTMPPNNVLWDSLNKLTSVITVEQDGEEVFRGRVMSDETDFYNQQYIYCEGELAYLLDSLQRPYEFDGNAVDLFKQFVTQHNACVNSEKQFAIGNITAVDESTEAEIDCDEYNSTFTEITTRLLNAYGGYIRVRESNGTRYLDYLSEAGDTSDQPIAFGVNLLDLKNSISAEDIFTVLIPTGAMQKGSNGRYTEVLKISDVNDGLDYLEDAEGVAKYGRIWQTKHWDGIEDPEKLKEKGLEYLQTGIAEDATLTITAVDMHFVNSDTQVINLGDTVRILSEPHGMDRLDICYKIVAPLQEPERTEYTFGQPKRDLTDNVVANNDTTRSVGGGGGQSIQEEMQDVIRWAYAQADESNATYDILTGEINEAAGRISHAEIRLDGVEATIALKADKTIVDEYGERISQAEINIDGAHAAIQLKADQSIVTEYGERLSQAEINIDGANAAINLKADRTEVSELGDRVSQAEINIDGANAAIQLKADQSTVTELGSRVTNAEIKVDGANAAISLKADATVVDEMGERVSAAEISIDGLNSEIALKADKITLNGYVTMSKFEALEGEINNLFSDDIVVNGGVSANYLVCGTLDADDLTFGTMAGKNVEFTTKTVLTGFTPQITKYSKSVMKSDGSSETITYVGSIDFTKNTSTIKYLAYK